MEKCFEQYPSVYSIESSVTIYYFFAARILLINWYCKSISIIASFYIVFNIYVYLNSESDTRMIVTFHKCDGFIAWYSMNIYQ